MKEVQGFSLFLKFLVTNLGRKIKVFQKSVLAIRKAIPWFFANDSHVSIHEEGRDTMTREHPQEVHHPEHNTTTINNQSFDQIST